MSLIGKVKSVCDRLTPLGWRQLLLDATNNALDIKQPTEAELKTVLTAPLEEINRTKSGFEDFHHAANRAVTGGRPAHSLLYHALASPAVHPTTDNQPVESDEAYPTLAELDVVENFIYSLVADREDLDDTFIAVFAYQYRVASRTTHLRHADTAYSRTGAERRRPTTTARAAVFGSFPSKVRMRFPCFLPAMAYSLPAGPSRVRPVPFKGGIKVRPMKISSFRSTSCSRARNACKARIWG